MLVPLFAVLLCAVASAGPPWHVAESLPGAFSVLAADANNDNLPDVLIGAASGTALLLSTSGGTFLPAKTVMPGYFARSLAAADFNGDGALDLALLFSLSGWVAILKGNGDGTFEFLHRLPASSMQSGGALAADFNNDGNLDLVIGQFNGVAVFPGNGDLTFQPAIESTAGGDVDAIVAFDCNHDGSLDLAVTTMYEVSILQGLGNGAFQPPVEVDPDFHGSAFDLAGADLNRDGYMDLAAASSAGLAAWIASPDGSFQSAQVFSERSSPSLSLAIADFDGDHIPDAVLGNYYSGKITILSGTGDGTFVERGRVVAMGDVFGVALSDLNGDGKVDLIATSHSSNSALISYGTQDPVMPFEESVFFGSCTSSYFRKAGINGENDRRIALFLPARKTAVVFSSDSETEQIISLRDYPMDAQFTDFNGDGNADLVIATLRGIWGTPVTVEVYLFFLAGRADGSFAAPVSDRVQSYPLMSGASAQWPAIAAGEFTGDTIPDLAISNLNTRSLTVLRGKGDGSFEQISNLSGLLLSKLIAANLDGAGGHEIAGVILGDGKPSAIAVFTAQAGVLRESHRIDVCSSVRSWTSGDFNGDSRTDLAVLCYDELLLLQNTGGGAFQITSRQPRKDAAEITSLTAGDFNRDGLHDLAFSKKINALWGTGTILSGGSAGGWMEPSAFALPPDPLAIVAATWKPNAPTGVMALSAQDATVSFIEEVLP